MQRFQRRRNDQDWQTVTTARPCAVCGAERGCRFRDAAFASCENCQSPWPMTNGAWLHRTEVLLDSTLPSPSAGT